MRTARAAGTIWKAESGGAVVEIRQCMEEYGMVEQIKSLECDD